MGEMCNVDGNNEAHEEEQIQGDDRRPTRMGEICIDEILPIRGVDALKEAVLLAREWMEEGKQASILIPHLASLEWESLVSCLNVCQVMLVFMKNGGKVPDHLMKKVRSQYRIKWWSALPSKYMGSVLVAKANDTALFVLKAKSPNFCLSSMKASDLRLLPLPAFSSKGVMKSLTNILIIDEACGREGGDIPLLRAKNVPLEDSFAALSPLLLEAWLLDARQDILRALVEAAEVVFAQLKVAEKKRMGEVHHARKQYREQMGQEAKAPLVRELWNTIVHGEGLDRIQAVAAALLRIHVPPDAKLFHIEKITFLGVTRCRIQLEEAGKVASESENIHGLWDMNTEMCHTLHYNTVGATDLYEVVTGSRRARQKAVCERGKYPMKITAFDPNFKTKTFCEACRNEIKFADHWVCDGGPGCEECCLAYCFGCRPRMVKPAADDETLAWLRDHFGPKSKKSFSALVKYPWCSPWSPEGRCCSSDTESIPTRDFLEKLVTDSLAVPVPDAPAMTSHEADRADRLEDAWPRTARVLRSIFKITSKSREEYVLLPP